MNESLLPYYSQEVTHLKRKLNEFASTNPNAGDTLKINNENIEDPHVNRLLDGFAFLTAELQQKLDNSFSELSTGLLESIYPEYLSILPSTSIVQFQPLGDLDKPYKIHSGDMLESSPINGDTCKFTIAYDTDLLPLTVKSAKFHNHTLAGPKAAGIDSTSVLEISLATMNSIEFSQLDCKKIRFFIDGDRGFSNKILDMILGHTNKLIIHDNNETVDIPITAIKQLGFDQEHKILPNNSKTPSAHATIIEYFAYSKKFQFIEINLSDVLKQFNSEASLYIYFDCKNSDLETYIDKDNFILNATPIINLFPNSAEPIVLDNYKSEYPVIANSNNPNNFEIYSIDNVSAITPSGEKIDYLPFYSTNYNIEQNSKLWTCNRRKLEGQDFYQMNVSLVDPDINIQFHQDNILSINTLCTNANLPTKLLFNNGTPYLQFCETTAPTKSIKCLMPFTKPSYLFNNNKQFWKLLSLLNLNVQTMLDEKCNNLKRMLELHCADTMKHSRTIISSIQSSSSKQILARDPNGILNSFCQGTEITINIDEKILGNESILQLGNVLNHFFASKVTLNSFIQLKIYSESQQRIIHQWQPTSGTTALT